MKTFGIFLGLLLSMTQVTFGAESLCAKSEDTYFSCSTRSGKIVSLCGKVFSTDNRGAHVEYENQWLQYRYGSQGTIELSYPRHKKDSLAKFKAVRIRAQGGLGHIDAVVFVSGGIGYSVESVSPVTGEILEGVSVGKPEKEFKVENQNKRREQYPTARILCAQRADTKNFFYLVEYVDTE